MERQLTAKDAPALRATMAAWKAAFHTDIERVFLYMIESHNTHQQVLHALSVTESWVRGRLPSVTTIRDAERYMIGVLKKNQALLSKVDSILGGVQ